MSLTIVSTPIGNLGDITLRALETLKACDLVIGEEHRITSTLLKKMEIGQKEIYCLNEHSKKDDLYELLDLCREKKVALISDCGTPGFADPGADLIRLCRQKGIPVTAAPGASSLMTLLSLSSQKMTQFVFLGFLPAEASERKKSMQDLKKEKRSWVLMDTPYRLKAVLQNLAELMPKEMCLLGLNLTQENEVILEGTFTEVLQKCPFEKAEFILLRYQK
jgi:16S rRNA (cytidine1402-2'-O)-methyltransferase